MRLSLRTLLAFEDNIFDVEQHRRLEQILPTDPHAEAVIQRIRSVVRNSSLGVPGLVDRQEELDPNYVAEYLDHQMSSHVQEKFEEYCLSADKYLAEIASIHHILSNVLGEPARTSRECRLKCYDTFTTNVPIPETKYAAAVPAPSRHFRPDVIPPAPQPVKPETFWNRWFPAKPAPQAPVEQKNSPLWTFMIIGLCIATLLFGWQQLEKQRFAQQMRTMDEAETFVTDNIVHENVANDDRFTFDVAEAQSEAAEPNLFLMTPALLSPLEPVEQAIYVTETSEIPPTLPVNDPFTAVAEVPPPAIPFPTVSPPVVQDIAFAEPPVPETPTTPPSVEVVKNGSPNEPPLEFSKISEEPLIAFQPTISSAKIPADVPVRQGPRPPLSIVERQSGEVPAPVPSYMPPAPMPMSVTPVQHSSPTPVPQPIVQTSGTAPRTLGRVMPMSQPSMVFTSPPPNTPWLLPPLPFDLHAEQYLLTAAPFRGTFELAGSFRIEMIGDTKLCVLPLDSSGTPGIFVDYGRVIIHPLQPNRPLRIEMEKSRGIVNVAGTESILFIDSFAEIFDAPNSTKPQEEQKAKTSPILGFVPKSGERIVWQAANQRQPLPVDSQGSVLLQSDQYRFGEIRHLPNWLGAIPMSPEDRMLAETCRRCFVDAGGDGEKALTWLIRDESRAVRTLGFRLWGDLGEFSVPLTVLSEKREEDESVRLVLVRYFEEVMRRDAETIQRFADAIEIIKEAKK